MIAELFGIDATPWQERVAAALLLTERVLGELSIEEVSCEPIRRLTASLSNLPDPLARELAEQELLSATADTQGGSA